MSGESPENPNAKAIQIFKIAKWISIILFWIGCLMTLIEPEPGTSENTTKTIGWTIAIIAGAIWVTIPLILRFKYDENKIRD